MEKARPGSEGLTWLTVQGYFAAFREGVPARPKLVRYEIVEAGRSLWLQDVQWADWDQQGRLLVATNDGRLQVRDYADKKGLAVVSEVALGHLAPSPSPAPVEAHRW